VKFNI